MASWTTVPDSSLEPGKPVRSIDILALRDNPIAIAEGASGAPRVALPAIIDALAAQSHAGLGSVTVAWNESTTHVASNSTLAGGSLRILSGAVASATTTNPPANQFGTVSQTSTGTFPTSNVTSLTGTWRNMGGFCRGRLQVGSGADAVYSWFPSVWLRIA